MSTKKKNILILTARVGHGHMNASKATQEAIEKLYPQKYQVDIIDFMELIGNTFKKTTEALFIKGSKFVPQFNRFFFEQTDKKGPIKLLNTINYPFLKKKLQKLLESKNPDLIISTFPAWDYLIKELCKKEKLPTKFISIITDSINIHTAWTYTDHDYHIVANTDTAKVIEEMGIPKEKIKALGFPIRQKFLEKTTKENFSQSVHIDPSKENILYLAMGETSLTVFKNIKTLLENHSAQILVVTGRDTKIIPKLKEKTQTLSPLSNRIHIFGWVDNLHEFIQHSRFIITKAGGSTTMEAIALAKPLIITKVIAGQEDGNAELIERHKLGVVLKKKGPTLKTALQEIESNYQQIEKNLKSHSNPKASFKIAEFIDQIL